MKYLAIIPSSSTYYFFLSLIWAIRFLNLYKFTQRDHIQNVNIAFNIEGRYLFNLVMDYIPETLSKLITNFKKNKKAFPN